MKSPSVLLHEFKFWCRYTHPIDKVYRPLEHSYWYLIHRFHPKHRYNILKTGLKPGYYDPDIQIVCAVFEAVKKFYLEAKIDWTHTDKHVKIYRELQSAVHYYENISTSEYELYEHLEDEELKIHLYNIIKNLGHLWYP